jgi:CheY-like chemotaxis protein
MKDILEEAGFDVLIAEDGAKALEIVAQTLPDCVILDLMMPGIDGFRGIENNSGNPNAPDNFRCSFSLLSISQRRIWLRCATTTSTSSFKKAM